MFSEKTKQQLQASFKSTDTEEWLDIYTNRPIGYMWALFFNKLGIHPNVVTLLSIALGVAAGVMFYYPDMPHTIAGIILLMWANHYDSADGQLARLANKRTLWGRILDGFAGDVWFISIYVAICLRLMSQPMPFLPDVRWGAYIWLLAAVAGLVCHTSQCRLADYYRNIHLYFLKGKAGSELDNAAQQRRAFDALQWKDSFWWKLFLFFYTRYTHSQEQSTPCFQRFYALVRQRYGDKIPQTLRKDFCAGSRPLMKYTNILTFNTRAIVLYVSMLCAVPWCYFLFECTVLTALYAYMHHRHEALCTALYHKYSKA